jgi:beta-mannanase
VIETVQVEYPIYKTEIEKKQNCYTFEDYYPGNKYVDIL